MWCVWVPREPGASRHSTQNHPLCHPRRPPCHVTRSAMSARSLQKHVFSVMMQSAAHSCAASEGYLPCNHTWQEPRATTIATCATDAGLENQGLKERPRSEPSCRSKRAMPYTSCREHYCSMCCVPPGTECIGPGAQATLCPDTK